jgi:DNA-binding NarL/FixJ family response regulator
VAEVEMPTRIAVVDDHQIVRQGLRAVLESSPDFSVVGEAASGLDVLPLVERLRPDVLVLDLMMPGLNGLEATRQVHQKYPAVRVVILSMHATESYVLDALRSGAVAYLLKSGRSSELVDAVRAVVAGKRYLSPPLSDRAVDAYARLAEGASDSYDTLTTREREVLQLAAEGHSSPDIASRLGISARTVETHRANLMRKLGLTGQTDLIRYSLRRGILPGE